MYWVQWLEYNSYVILRHDACHVLTKLCYTCNILLYYMCACVTNLYVMFRHKYIVIQVSSDGRTAVPHSIDCTYDSDV